MCKEPTKPPRGTPDPVHGMPMRAWTGAWPEPLKPPRWPFNRLVGGPCSYPCVPRCQLCKKRCRLTILSVGPWAICEECLKVLDEVLRDAR